MRETARYVNTASTCARESTLYRQRHKLRTGVVDKFDGHAKVTASHSGKRPATPVGDRPGVAFRVKGSAGSTAQRRAPRRLTLGKVTYEHV